MSSLCLKPWEVRGFIAGNKTAVARPVGRTGEFRPLAEWATRVAQTCNADPSDEEIKQYVDRHTGKLFPFYDSEKNELVGLKCPFATIGDRIPARETWAECECACVAALGRRFEDCKYCHGDWRNDIVYKADHDVPIVSGWRSPATMSGWAVRIWLTVKSVQVKRAQDLTDDECVALGVADFPSFPFPGNPWVWVVDVETEVKR